jgi:hypothetical protein
MEKNDNNSNNSTNNEIDRVNVNPSTVKANACAAYHILFSIIDKMLDGYFNQHIIYIILFMFS